MQCMVASSIPCKLSLCADRAHARAGDSHTSSGIDVACPTTQNVLAIASPHELQGDSWPSSPTGTSSFCCNQQYSITAVTTSTGSIAERYAYTAYGQPTILDASASVLSSSAINNRYTYTGREWDATLGLHHFRARWMSPSAGRFVTRDPIEFLDGFSLYSTYFSLDLGDPLGLLSQPPYSEPGYTNCAGYALGNGISIQPGDGSIIEMTVAMGYKCFGGIGALGCKGYCKGKPCAVGYIYIRKGMPAADEQRIRQLLEWLVQNSTDPRVSSIDELVLYKWNEVLRWLSQMGIRYPDGHPPIDFHFLKCTLPEEILPGDYEYQPCRAQFGSPQDCRSRPEWFTPTLNDPEYFPPNRLLSKMCCCKVK